MERTIFPAQRWRLILFSAAAIAAAVLLRGVLIALGMQLLAAALLASAAHPLCRQLEKKLPAGVGAALSLLILLAGTVMGLMNGALIAYGKLPPFIATLGTMKIFRSVTQQLTKTFNPTVPAGFKLIASAKIGNQVILPIVYWVLIVIAMHIIFKKTALGRQTIAIGSNERAAKLSGIHVAKVKLKIYALTGIMVAFASIIYLARIGSMDFANAGSGYEMDAIAAVIVGGTAMSGGKGSLVGAFVGMLIMGVMNNILNSVGVPTFLCDAIKGAIIIFAVMVQKKDNT